MRISKYIDISREVEIDLTVEDLVLIFDDIDPEKQHHILRQITSMYQFLKALPSQFIEGLSNELKETMYSAFTAEIKRFKPQGEDDK